MKKIAIVLIFVMSILSIGVTANSDLTTMPSEEQIGRINEQFHNLMDYFVDEGLCNEDSEYPDFYAGAYITEDYDKLVVCVTDTSERVRQIIVAGTGNPNIELKEVAYSYNELLSAKDRVLNNYSEAKQTANMKSVQVENLPEIVSVSVSIKSNGLEIGVLNHSVSYAESDEYAMIDAIADFPNVNIIQGDYGRGEASYSPGATISTSVGSSTMGNRGNIKLKDSNNYVRGFWMAGHAVANTGNSVYNGSQKSGVYIGSCIAKKSSGNLDVAFVKLDDQEYDVVSNSVGSITLSDSAYISSFAEDETVYMYGSVSGLEDGRIKSTSYSFTTDDSSSVSYSDFVKATYSSRDGDSGAVIYVKSGSTYKAAGLHYGLVESTYRAFCKIKNAYSSGNNNDWTWQSWN